MLDVQTRLLARLGPPSDSDSDNGEKTNAGPVPLDALLSRLVTGRGREPDRPILLALLGMDPMPDESWPGLGDVAKLLGVDRGRVAAGLERALSRWRRNSDLKEIRNDLARLLRGDDEPAASAGVLTADEIALALLPRGCEAAEPLRIARAVVRATVETERSAAEPRFVLARAGELPIVAKGQELADYAVRLGDAADELAGLDPLASPVRALERLRAVAPPRGMEPLPESRLLRLAAAASRGAAVSGRRELYPRGMDALRALRLSRGALVAPELTAEEIRRRVADRYPLAEPLPEQPEDLRAMLPQVGLGLLWNPEAAGGVGAFVPPPSDDYLVSSVTRSRLPVVPLLDAVDIDLDEAVRRQFEERLDRALRDKAFLVLMVDRKRFAPALERLQQSKPILRSIDLEALVLRHLEDQAVKAGVRWERVLSADAASADSRDWKNLLRLVSRVIPAVEQEVLSSPQPVLLYHAGLLPRYDQMEALARLREASGRPGRPPGIWLLVVGDGALPLIDRQAVPILSPGQRVFVPPPWVDQNPGKNASAKRR